jgi:hypothetical protein
MRCCASREIVGFAQRLTTVCVCVQAFGSPPVARARPTGAANGLPAGMPLAGGGDRARAMTMSPTAAAGFGGVPPPAARNLLMAPQMPVAGQPPVNMRASYAATPSLPMAGVGQPATRVAPPSGLSAALAAGPRKLPPGAQAIPGMGLPPAGGNQPAYQALPQQQQPTAPGRPMMSDGRLPPPPGVASRATALPPPTVGGFSTPPPVASAARTTETRPRNLSNPATPTGIPLPPAGARSTALPPPASAIPPGLGGGRAALSLSQPAAPLQTIGEGSLGMFGAPPPLSQVSDGMFALVCACVCADERSRHRRCSLARRRSASCRLSPHRRHLVSTHLLEVARCANVRDL